MKSIAKNGSLGINLSTVEFHALSAPALVGRVDGDKNICECDVEKEKFGAAELKEETEEVKE